MSGSLVIIIILLKLLKIRFCSLPEAIFTEAIEVEQKGNGK